MESGCKYFSSGLPAIAEYVYANAPTVEKLIAVGVLAHLIHYLYSAP
jgi:hypothetical protein